MRLLIALLVLIGCLGAVALGLSYRHFLSTPLALDAESVRLDVERGTSLRTLSEQLAAKGFFEHPYLFLAMAHLRGESKRIRAGEYEVRKGTTPPELLALLTSGKVVQHAFTLVEGWTFRQVLAALARDARLEPELGSDATATTVMASLGNPDQDPEGRFFPDTYYFTKGTSDRDLLRRAYATMGQILAQEWEQRGPGLPFESPYQALILASIVEKETGRAAERPLIAGVFVRRLELGMKLQTDPAVIYGLGEAFAGNLTRAHLDQDGPYNTYTRTGLPPTPIALPGRDALRAVLHPAAGNSLYFVAKGDGSHYFSATLEEHNRAVRRYQSTRVVVH